MDNNTMENIGKSQKFFIIMSVLFIIVGIVLLIWPNITVDLLGKSIGIGMLVLGVTHLIIYFTRDHMATILQMDLTVGVIMAAFGAFMLMHADFVEMALPFGIGILLLIGAMTTLQYAIDMKRVRIRAFRSYLFFAFVLIILGILLIYNPFSQKVLVYVIAGSLILDGLLNVTSVLILSHRMKKIARGEFQAVVPGYQPQGNTPDNYPQGAPQNAGSTPHPPADRQDIIPR